MVIIMKQFNNNKGSMLVILIIAMTLIAVLGASFVSFVGSKQQGFTYLLNGHRANMIAKAGIEWAIRFASEGNDVSDIKDKNFVPNTPENGSFSTSYNDDEDVLTVDGIYQGVKATITLSNFRRYLKSGDISFPLSMESFKPVESQDGKSITVEPTGVISLGQGVSGTSGAVWYGGDSTAGKCVNGACAFGKGFRAYFVFQFAPGSAGDGFTFAVIDGTNNTASSIGGDPEMGELMAYGGDSRLLDDDKDIYKFVDGTGNGLRPPKFAVEFDIYPNTGCPADPCASESRCDLPGEQHIAYVFWGNDNPISCKDRYTRWMSSFKFPANAVIYGTTENDIYRYRLIENPTIKDPTTGKQEPDWAKCVDPLDVCSDNTAWWQRFNDSPPIGYATNSRTYDDNKHGAGTGSTTNTMLCNSDNDGCSDSCSYYKSPTNPTTWLADRGNFSTDNPTYAYRMEVVRDSATRTYRITSWIKACDPTGSPPTWSRSTEYKIHDLVRPTVNNGYNYIVRDIAREGGRSGVAEPTWSASRTVTDNDVTWEPVPMTICNEYTNGAFGNVQSNYPTDSDCPTLRRTVTIDEEFDKFLFGWTTASGGATQKADVWKFRMSFRR